MKGALFETVLIPTVDYELFGDGSGDVCRDQISPTNELAEVIESIDGAMTVFVEYGQCQRLRGTMLQEDLRDIGFIEDQLRSLAVRGHGIELHVHPTWFSNNRGSASRDVDLGAYDLSDFEVNEIERIIVDGKNYLEDLIRPAVGDYSCRGFRAGAWSMRRPEKVLSVLKKAGFTFDSSVVPGGFLVGGYGSFDYRSVPPRAFWRIERELLVDSLDGALVELPVCSVATRFAPIFYLNRAGLQSRRLTRQRYREPAIDRGRSKFQKILRKLSRSYLPADIDTLDVAQLMWLWRKWSAGSREGSILPMVLVSHSKTCHNPGVVRELFNAIRKQGGECKVMSAASWVSRVNGDC